MTQAEEIGAMLQEFINDGVVVTIAPIDISQNKIEVTISKLDQDHSHWQGKSVLKAIRAAHASHFHKTK